MLRQLGLYITKDARFTALIALALGLLFLLGLPVLLFGYVLLALVVLHEGPKTGLWLLGGLVVVPSIVLLLMGTPPPVDVLARGVAIWLLAWILRRNASWAMVSLAAALMGVLAVIVFHLSVADAAEWWRTAIGTFLKQIGTHSFGGVSPVDLRLAVNKMSPFLTGIFVMFMLLYSMIILLLARGWQALLFNPGGLKKEFLAIRIPKVASIVLSLCLGVALLGVSLAQDVIAVFFLPFMIAGIGLVHASAEKKAEKKKEMNLLILLCFYAAFIFFLPYVVLLLILAGLIDSWYNFRSLDEV